ncbi:MAG: hypothetical protein ACREOB_08930, partial [Thermodesulfobacteriota bacterium]
YKTEISENAVEVSGSFGLVKLKLPTPFKFVLFRIGLLTLGRFSSNLVRTLLQKMLITGKKSMPFWFKRTFVFADSIKIIDEVKYVSKRADFEIEKLYVGVDHTSIYVVMSNTYQESVLKNWIDLSEFVSELNEKEYIKVERIIENNR